MKELKIENLKKNSKSLELVRKIIGNNYEVDVINKIGVIRKNGIVKMYFIKHKMPSKNNAHTFLFFKDNKFFTFYDLLKNPNLIEDANQR